MSKKSLIQLGVPIVLAAALAAGCGSSKSSGGSTTGSSNGSVAAEAKATATGDIPDNQNFLTYRNSTAGWSMRYPEGWAQKGSASTVTFQDKDNLVRVAISKGAVPTPASVTGEIKKLKALTPSVKTKQTETVSLGGKKLVKVTYTTRSAPNPVTGKRVTLTVDRYELGKHGKVAVVELATPVGVDNVDAYKMMIGSFKWL
ncbi:MAG: hypothetical protein ACJ76V_13485 [Thermoleophilaceae bacterium]